MQPTVAQLEAAAGAGLRTCVERYTRCPTSCRPSIAKLAKRITAKAEHRVRQGRRAAGLVPQHRRLHLRHDRRTPASGADAVSAFLASKHGYCVQFSSAMAVMARLLGIPARIGVGFLPGTKQSNGSWSVSLNDAHAWPELYFEGVGWVRFEPTPAVRTGAAAVVLPAGNGDDARHGATSSAAVPSPHDSANPGLSGKTSRRPASGKTTVWRSAASRGDPPAGQGLGPARPAGPARGAGHPRRCAAWPAGGDADGAGDAIARAEAAWAELLERVGDLGIDLPAGATPRQTQQRLSHDALAGRRGRRRPGPPGA